MFRTARKIFRAFIICYALMVENMDNW